MNSVCFNEMWKKVTQNTSCKRFEETTFDSWLNHFLFISQDFRRSKMIWYHDIVSESELNKQTSIKCSANAELRLCIFNTSNTEDELNLVTWTIFTNLKLLPTKCLAMWSIASFSKKIFRWISLSGSFGGGGFGNSTMIPMLNYFHIDIHRDR